MGSFSLYNGCGPPAYLPLQPSSPDAKIRGLPYEDWDLPNVGAYSNSDRFDHEERTKTQPTWPLLTLPLEISIYDLAADQLQDVEHAPLVSTTTFGSYKRKRETVTLPLLTPQSSGSITSPEDFVESSPASTLTDVRLSEWDHNDGIAALDSSKPLLSPIKFTPPCKSKVPNLASTQPGKKGNGSSTYLFYPPRNPADKAPQTSDPTRNVPQRQLSYGEPIHTPTTKSLHRATGSSELRRKAGWEADSDGLGSRLEGSLKASTIRPWFSEPARSKPSLWLDLAEDEKIEEAVRPPDVTQQTRTMLMTKKHATTVTSSPTKPQLISIPSRRAATTTTGSAPTAIPHGQRTSSILSATPLDTGGSLFGLGTESIEEFKEEKERLAFEKIKARPTWITIPPTITISTPGSTETLRNTPLASIPKTRPDTPRPFQTSAPQLSEFTTWILTELDHSLSGPESSKLQLNNPVIQQLRLPPSQRRVPRSPPSTLPLSRYSSYNPLSSHPPSVPSPFINPETTSSAPLTALRIIFPDAPLFLLDALQATLLALHHVSSIHLPSPSPNPSPFSPPDTYSPPSESTPLHTPDISYIPSKARAMLGLQPPATSRPVRPTLPSSWLRPQVLSWGERVEGLEVRLRREVEALVEECLSGGMHGESVEKVKGPLVRAVGEVVRMGQRVRT